MLKAVIWDFDGTICDTYPAIAYAVNAALASFHASPTFERIVELASISLDRCIHTLAAEHAIPYEQLDAAFKVTYQHVRPVDQPPFPGVVDLCQQLARAGIYNFIVTHRRRASLRVLLATHALESYFTDIIAADDGFPRKPAPDAIVHLLATYGIAPAEALVVGDRDIDILAGQAAGVPTCLFRASFADLRPTHTIMAYQELADLVSQAASSR
jgi:HAD superfamily hydrolase (TIGR01509 family)